MRRPGLQGGYSLDCPPSLLSYVLLPLRVGIGLLQLGETVNKYDD